MSPQCHLKSRVPLSSLPLLLCLAESSDDSYVSAGEEPLEAPVFEIPLQNMVVAPGADVLLKCIITANPPPQGEQQGKLEADRLWWGSMWYGDRIGFLESSYGMVGKRKIVRPRGCPGSGVFWKTVPYFCSSGGKAA